MRIIRISDAQTRAGLPCNDAGIDCEQHAGVENTFDSTIRPHTMAPSMRIAEEEFPHSSVFKFKPSLIPVLRKCLNQFCDECSPRIANLHKSHHCENVM